MVSKQFLDLDADFDSDDSGEPHGDFLALVNKQLLIEREAEKILKFMNGGSDDIETEADNNRQHDGESNGHTDAFACDVYNPNTVIKTEKYEDGETPLRKSYSDVPAGNSVPVSQAPASYFSQSAQNTWGTAKVKTESRDLPQVSQSSIAYSQNVALSSLNLTRNSGTGIPVSAGKPLLPVPVNSQLTQKTPQIKTEKRGSPKGHIPPHSKSPVTSPNIALVPSTYTPVSQQTGLGSLAAKTVQTPVGSFSPYDKNAGTSVYPSSTISKPLPRDTKPNQLFSTPSAYAVSGPTTQVPKVVQGQTVHTLPPGYQLLPQMTWQGQPIIRQPFSGVVNNNPPGVNTPVQTVHHLPNASTVLSTGSAALPYQVVSSTSSVTTGASTQPIQATTLYRVIPIMQQPFVINAGTLDAQPTLQTTLASTQSTAQKLNPVNVPSNQLLTQTTTLPHTVNSQSPGSILQTVQPNLMGQVLLPQATGLTIGSLNSNGLVYQMPQLNLANYQSNGLVFQPPATTSGGLSSHNVTLQAPQANFLGSLQSSSTTLQNSPQPNKASLPSNSSVVQTSQSDNGSLQPNTAVKSEGASSTLPSLWEVLALLQQNATTLNTQTQQNTTQGLANVINPLSNGPSSNVFTNRYQILSALNGQIQQNLHSTQVLSNTVNPSSTGLTALTNQATSTLKTHNTAQGLLNAVDMSYGNSGSSLNILANLQQTPSTSKSQTQQNTGQGSSNIINPSPSCPAPEMFTNILQTSSTLKSQNTAQGLPNPMPDSASQIVFTNRQQILSALNKQIQQIPNQAGPLLGGVVGQIPTPVGQIATPVGQIPTLVGQIPTPVGQIPTPVGQIPTPVGQIPTPVGQIPTSDRQIPTPVGQIPTPVGQIPTPVRQIPTPVGQIPTPVEQIPTPAEQIPTRMRLMPTQAGQIATQAGQIPTQAGQIPTPVYDLVVSNPQAPPPTVPQLPPLTVPPADNIHHKQHDVQPEAMNSVDLAGSVPVTKLEPQGVKSSNYHRSMVPVTMGRGRRSPGLTVPVTQGRGVKRPASYIISRPHKHMKILPKPVSDIDIDAEGQQ